MENTFFFVLQFRASKIRFNISPCLSGILSIYPPVYLVLYSSVLLYIWYFFHLSSCISGIISIYPPVYLVLYPSILLYIWYYIHLSPCISGILSIYPPVYLVYLEDTWRRSAWVSKSSGFSPGCSRQSWQRVMRPSIKNYQLFLHLYIYTLFTENFHHSCHSQIFLFFSIEHAFFSIVHKNKLL